MHCLFVALGPHLLEHGQSRHLHAIAVPVPWLPAAGQTSQELPACSEQHGGKVWNTAAAVFLLESSQCLSQVIDIIYRSHFVYFILREYCWWSFAHSLCGARKPYALILLHILCLFDAVQFVYVRKNNKRHVLVVLTSWHMVITIAMLG